MPIIAISGKIHSGKDTVAKIIQYLTVQNEPPFSDKFCNPAEFGLDYVENSPWKIAKFAGKLKEFVADMIGCSVEDLEKQEVKSSNLTSQWDRYLPNLDRPEKMKVRDVLIGVGNGLRDSVHPDIWVNYLFKQYRLSPTKCHEIGKCLETESFKGTEHEGIDMCEDGCVAFPTKLPNWIITDLRYENEKRRIEEYNGITIRVNSDRCQYIDSPSETSLDKAQFKYVIENNYSDDPNSMKILSEKVKQILLAEKIIK